MKQMKKFFKTFFKNPDPLVKVKGIKTVTFKDKDGLFIFTVRWSFLRNCPKPETCDIETLAIKGHLNKYLHSVTGPAVVYTDKFPLDVRTLLLTMRSRGIYRIGLTPVAYWYNGNLISYDKWNALRQSALKKGG